eukprot:jgi/Ulvmu1/11658/UM008_0063.1
MASIVHVDRARATGTGSLQCATLQSKVDLGKRAWLEWLISVLRTTPELMSERHPNPVFVLFLALCFPTIVAAILLFVLGWGTGWNPYWYFVLSVYCLNILAAPYFLRFSREYLSTNMLTRIWRDVIVAAAICCTIVGLMLGGTTARGSPWLPFGDVSLSTMAGYVQVPAMIISEHVLLIHNPQRTGTVPVLLSAYIIAGTRLEEARADIVFGSRILSAAAAGHCPYRGRTACAPRFAVACTIICASAIDYTTEVVEMHALAFIAPHIPLAVKNFRADVVKMACELVTLAAILVFLFNDMGATQADADTALQQAETQRYAYVCVATTLLAIAHVLFMLLVSDASWARAQVRVRVALETFMQRLSVLRVICAAPSVVVPRAADTLVAVPGPAEARAKAGDAVASDSCGPQSCPRRSDGGYLPPGGCAGSSVTEYGIQGC